MSWSYSKWLQRKGPLQGSWMAARDRELHRISVADWRELRDLAYHHCIRWRWWYRVVTTTVRRDLHDAVKTWGSLRRMC